METFVVALDIDPFGMPPDRFATMRKNLFTVPVELHAGTVPNEMSASKTVMSRIRKRPRKPTRYVVVLRRIKLQ